jgi:hypothetical protein
MNNSQTLPSEMQKEKFREPLSKKELNAFIKIIQKMNTSIYFQEL